MQQETNEQVTSPKTEEGAVVSAAKSPARRSSKPKWIKPRHQVIRCVAKPLIATYCRRHYPGLTWEPLTGSQRQCLIVYNHVTALDQFLVAMLFPQHVYHLATEDLFSNGWKGRLLRWAVAPIPIRKNMTDMKAIKDCLTVAKEGGTIALAPEGNRTYDGRTCRITPTLAKLIKRLDLPLAVVRIEGGYGEHPRWGEKPRRGRMRAYVSQIMEPADYKDLSDQALFEKLRDALHVDESTPGGHYESQTRAEYMERLFYVCPHCGLSTFESKGNTIACRHCGMSADYEEDKSFSPAQGDFPFGSIGGWYDYQEAYINDRLPEQWGEDALYEEAVSAYLVHLYDRKELLPTIAKIRLYGTRVELVSAEGDVVCDLPFGALVGVSVLGRNKLNLYHGETLYQIKGDKGFNAVKYLNFYHRFTNVEKGEPSDKFLGL